MAIVYSYPLNHNIKILDELVNAAKGAKFTGIIA